MVYFQDTVIPDVDWLDQHHWLVLTVMVVVEVASSHGENDGDDGYHQLNCDSIVNGQNNIRGHHWNGCMRDDCGDDCHLGVL